MDDWWVWSSADLVSWKLESVLNPEDTYIGKAFDQCWATDAAFRNGKYYWYFSEGNEQAGVVVGETPIGPWKDPLGKPLLDSTLTPTDEYDMTVFQDDDGEFYILFGVWDYYMARLNENMISLAEEPRKVSSITRSDLMVKEAPMTNPSFTNTMDVITCPGGHFTPCLKIFMVLMNTQAPL